MKIPCGRIARTDRGQAVGTVGDMIGYLRGTVRGDVIDVAGVGYVVTCPTDLPAGETVELFVRTLVRETSITLYGFSTNVERDVFDALCKAAGVGPAMALNLLALGVPALAAAFAGADTKALTAAKGVGAARAARILVEVTLPPDAVAQTGEQQPAGAPSDPLLAALTAMGYDQGCAAHALSQVRTAHPDASDDVVALSALRALRTAVAS